jgi:uncharacterized protein DUF6412
VGFRWGTVVGVSWMGVLLGAVLMTSLLLAVVVASRHARGRQATPPAPLRTRRTLRAHTERAGVPRHRDPDAAGHARPRAPTAVPATA